MRDASGREKEFLMERGRKKRKKKGRKSSEKYVFVASGEVETGKGTKEGQLDNSVTKS